MTSSRRVPRRMLIAALGAGAALALAALLALVVATGRVESTYAAWLGPAIRRAATTLSGRVPFGLAEPALVLGGLWLAGPALGALGRARRARGPAHVLRAAGRGTLGLALRAAALALWFYAAWGLNYARPPLVERQGWGVLAAAARPAEVDRDELARLADAWVARANEAYRAVHGTADARRPTALGDAVAAGGDAWAELDGALDLGFRAAARELREPAAFALPHGPVKPVRASEAMSRLQLAGFFFPWTGEANVNRHMPPVQLPHTMAHEKAHQRGIASEDEANFVGFLAAVRSPSPLARYSGHLFAQRQLLGELCARDAAACDALLARRLPGVQRDVDAARAFWARFEGPAADAHEALNDAYLEAHGVAGGVDSYARSVRLLVVWARASGGSAALGTRPEGGVPPPAGRPARDPG